MFHENCKSAFLNGYTIAFFEKTHSVGTKSLWVILLLYKLLILSSRSKHRIIKESSPIAKN